MGDTVSVSRFFENAVELLQAAESSTAAGHRLSEMTILVHSSGGIQLVTNSDWPLDRLRADRGAGMAYRISQQGDTVRIEGRAGSRTCLFESAKPDGAARHPLAIDPDELLRPMIPRVPFPVGAARLLPAARS